VRFFQRNKLVKDAHQFYDARVHRETMPKISSVHHCQLRMASNVMDDFSFPYIYSWADVERSSTGAHLRTYPCTTHVRVTARSELNHRARPYACVRVHVCGDTQHQTLASAIPWIISGANELFRSSLLSPRLHCTEISVRFSLSALIIPHSPNDIALSSTCTLQ